MEKFIRIFLLDSVSGIIMVLFSYMEKKANSKEEFIFLFFVCLIFYFGMFGLVKAPKKTSTAENRSLAQFTDFTVSRFSSGKFQDNFEKAFSDQFLMSEEIRVSYGEAMSNISTFGLNDIICKDHYIYLPGTIHTNTYFDCDDYIIPLAMDIDPKVRDTFSSDILYRNIEKFNYANTLADVYYYYIEQPQLFNFEQGDRILDLEKNIRENMQGEFKIDSLRFENYEEFKKDFYKTDHHWNYIGSYRGYKDIMGMFDMMPVAPVGTVTSIEDSFGSKARESRFYKFKEKFTAYEFDIPEHDTYINRKMGRYGSLEDLPTHNYIYDKNMNFYETFYGNNCGEILFDFHQPERENLLIVSNSFANPIKPLIAQHFNKTDAFDPRYYKYQMGEVFQLSEYIDNNNIDKILFIINPLFIYEGVYL